MVEFYKVKQKNGLTILFEKRDLPIVTIMVATRAGAAYENLRNKGIAHFFEHIVFKGTKTRTVDEISSSIEKVGGIINAFTSEQITAFWAKIPSKYFNIGANVIFDLVSNPKLAIRDIDREKGVILSEIDRAHDLPNQYLLFKIKEFLYKTPFGMPILGLKENILRFKRKNFIDWHKYYNPQDLIISVVGNANLKDINDLAKNYFKIPAKKILPKIKLIKKSNHLIEKRHGLDQTHFTLGFHSPSLSDKQRYTSELFNAILGEGMSSILFREVREKRGWAYTIHSYLEQEKDYGYSIIYAGIKKENIKKVRDIVLREIKNMSKIKIKDLEEAKEQKIGNWELGSESCDNVATNLILQEIATKAEDVYDYPEKIYEVKITDLKKLAKIKSYSTAILAPN